MGHPKDPAGDGWYGKDWSDWLSKLVNGDGEIGTEVIASSTWTLDPENVDTALVIEDTAHTDTLGLVRVSGGTVGAAYKITNHVVSSGSAQEDEFTDTWVIRER